LISVWLTVAAVSGLALGVDWQEEKDSATSPARVKPTRFRTHGSLTCDQNG
jgi:hypothetical protein